MKVTFLILLMSFTNYLTANEQLQGTNRQKAIKRAEPIQEEQSRKKEVIPLPLPSPNEFGDRTYSAPTDRIDEVRQEMKIDEKRDRAEERAKEI